MSNKIKLLSIWIIWSLNINFQYGSNHQQPTGLSFNKILKVFSLLAIKQTLAQVTTEILPMEYGVVGLDYYTSFLDDKENCQVYQLDDAYKLKNIFITKDASCVMKCFIKNVDLPNIRDSFTCDNTESLPTQSSFKNPTTNIGLSNKYFTGLSTKGTECEVKFLSTMNTEEKFPFLTGKSTAYKFYNEDNCQNYCSAQLSGVFLPLPSPYFHLFCHNLEKIITKTTPTTEEYRIAYWKDEETDDKCVLKIFDGKMGLKYTYTSKDTTCTPTSCSLEDIYKLDNTVVLANEFTCDKKTAVVRPGINTPQNTIHRFTSFVTNSQCVLKKSNYRNQEIEEFTTNIEIHPNCKKTCNVDLILDYQTTLSKVLANNFDCPVEKNPSSVTVNPSNKNDNYKTVSFKNGLCFFSDSTLTQNTCLYPISQINPVDINNKLNKNKILNIIDQIANDKLTFTLNSGENIVILLESLVQAMDENRKVVYQDQEFTAEDMFNIIKNKINYSYGKAKIADLIADNIDANNYCYQFASEFCGSDSCTLDNLKTKNPSTMNFLCNSDGLKLVEGKKAESIVFQENTCFFSTGLADVGKCNYLDNTNTVKLATVGSLVTDHKTDSDKVCYTWQSKDASCTQTSCTSGLLKNINNNDFKCWDASFDNNNEICYITQGKSLYKDCSVSQKTDCDGLKNWTGNEVLITKKAFDDCFVTAWNDNHKICYGNTPSSIFYKNCKITTKKACEQFNLGSSESPYGNKILMDFFPLNGNSISSSECYNTKFLEDNNRCYFSFNSGTKYVNCQTGNQKNCLNFNGPIDLNEGIVFRQITGQESVTDCVTKLESVKFSNGICYGTLVNSLNKPLGKFANCNIKNIADCNALKTQASGTFTQFTPLATFFESANDCFSSQWDSVNKVCYTTNNRNEKWAFCDIQVQSDCINSNINWKNGLLVDSLDSLQSICPKKVQSIIFDSKTSICYTVDSERKFYKICDFSYEDCYKLNKGMLANIDQSILINEDEPNPDPKECLRFYEFNGGKCYTQDNNGQIYEISKKESSEITEEQCNTIQYTESIHQVKTMAFGNGVIKTVGAIVVGFIGVIFY